MMLPFGDALVDPAEVSAVGPWRAPSGEITHYQRIVLRGGAFLYAPQTGEAIDQLAAISSAIRALADPWRPGAHDEERLAVGGVQLITSLPLGAIGDVERHAPIPDGLQPAPGGAGRWRVEAHYVCAGAAAVAMMRWLVPVQP